MTPVQVDPSLQARLDAAQVEAQRPLTRDEVAEIVSAVVSSMDGDVSSVHLKLYHELESLAQFIQNAKREIAAIRPDEISSTHIPSATDELDAVVGATEDATGRILDACETIEKVATQVDAANGELLTNVATSVYEACNFQDITGQRITKVVRTLKSIEGQVNAILSAFGDHVEMVKNAAAHAAAEPAVPSGEVMHGPQLPGAAINQAEIDRLLASFD